MYHRLISKEKFVLSVLLILLLLSGCRRQKAIEIPIELKDIQKIIQKETKYSENKFRSIIETELNNCNVNIYINIYIKNDTINTSEESLTNYVKTVSKRVNKALKDKECYKTLMIETSSNNYKKLKNRIHSFEFPIE
ncbi:hypothetical protein FLACOL_02136 [Flavobacterium columnare]|uniref:Lipoprotein n=2 Tax=Flavobacterium TaxID=237 RepID=A0A2N9PCQ4_9FLAO|nr:hypothetical protein [Flavobacterium columnare]RVU90471.1 hypothetical protein EH230_05910 [Flavobacterium columnare]SPE78121.1 hypothetical protein FLACOL_02136 [Flavobacterium columnare]